MSKDNQSRIPMREGFSRIPMPGSSQSKTSINCKKPPSQTASKLSRPTETGHSLRSSNLSLKTSQFTKSGLTNLTSRITQRSAANEKDLTLPQDLASYQRTLDNFVCANQLETVFVCPQLTEPKVTTNDDQMLINETIDLVGSDENFSRFNGSNLSKENLTFNPTNATFELCRRDGTFIKSPATGIDRKKIIGASQEELNQRIFVGSVNSLLDQNAKKNSPNSELPANRDVSKSRDSLLTMPVNLTRTLRLRKSGDILLGSSVSLPKSPEWVSEDMLNTSLDSSHCHPKRASTNVFNSTMMHQRLVDLTPVRPFLNMSVDSNKTPVNATKLLCMSQNDSTILVTHETAMEIDEREIDPASENSENDDAVVMRNIENRMDPNKRFSFGLDITECTLDCSIEFCDASLSSTLHKTSPMDTKHGSFDVDESLGILTPDQMKEFLDSTNTNHTNHANNLDLPLISGHKLSLHYRMDQTPSPEELPLDPVGVKTDMMDEIHSNQQLPIPSTSQQEVSQTESDPKTEMTKSSTSKVSNSIITSITSITSLDTGYIGDGEMSRPASRGAGTDQSPSKVPQNQIAHQPINWHLGQQAPVYRRQDPMTDSDFFTESDADDIFHQNQRRARVIDGQLYGPMLQGAMFIQQPPRVEDSCMESSGIFTDIENRGDDDLLHRLVENRGNHENLSNDMSPDLSSDTISSNTACSQKKLNGEISSPTQHISEHQQHDFIHNVTSSSINTSISSVIVDEYGAADTINLISDCSLGSTKSCVVVSNESEKTTSTSTKIIKKVSSSMGKKLNGSGRKLHKNETNYGLKKHETMASRSASKIKILQKMPRAISGSDENLENKYRSGSAKKCLNGKWEAVMNKIAENKSIKKSFDNVKSKVTCGTVKRSSPVKTPPSDDHSIASVETMSTAAKRDNVTGPSSSKRGRTIQDNKDSQQSSQSDLSLNGTVTSSTNPTRHIIRSAKKRDVRTINSSDLGPPSKTSSSGTNGTPRSTSRNILSLQKRTPALQQNATAPTSQIQELKASPPAKKSVPKRTPSLTGSPQAHVKSPFKDNNRLAGTGTPPPAVSNVSPRSSLRSNNSIKTSTPPSNNNAIRNGIESLSVSAKTKAKELENNNSNKITNKNNSNASRQLHLADKKALENTKQMINTNNLLTNKSVEALGVLVQYLVYNLDAFSCPSLKKSHQKTSKLLLETRNYLDEVKLSCHGLEEKLNDREEYFVKRESELQEFHRCEISKVKKCIEDLENEKREKIESLEMEMIHKQNKAEEKLRVYINSSNEKIKSRDSALATASEREDELLKRIQSLTITENELREKVHSSELEFSDRLHSSNIRERELSEKINHLTKQIDELRMETENEKRELEEKLNLSQDELTVIRHSRNSSANESFHNRTVSQSHSQILQDEIESLRCVLELKQSEISELRKHNCELQRTSDQSIAAQIKCSALESRVEDLQVQLQAKQEEEKDLLYKIKQIQDQYDATQKKSTRLSLHNEELQWRLKQNSERYSIAINELSKSYHEQSSFMANRTAISFQDLDVSIGKSNSSIVEGDADPCNIDGAVSPPNSPIIKGVVEKSDSVSWVLEMDDETPEALASRMVRRAGSFRSDKCSPSPVPKRQKCQNNTSIQQSASATSIMRHHSEPSPSKVASSIRYRSKSVSNKSVVDPLKDIGTKDDGWKTPQLTSSSPNPKNIQNVDDSVDAELITDEDIGKNDFFLDDGITLNPGIPFSRSRASTFNAGTTFEEFHRDKAPHFKKTRENRGLITCDTAALTASEIKKLRRPKIGAGEAMISGSNSEDDEEGSASSSVSTSPSPSISSNSSSNQQPLKINEDTLMRQIRARFSESSTPMEVSWCDDGEPTESVV